MRLMTLFLSMLIGLSACATSTSGIAQVAAADGAPVYTLDTGDKVRVTVYGEQSVNGEYAIGPSGDIAFPLIGNVPAKGQTVSQLQEAITQKLAAGYILDPRVSIDVLSYRPYFILGEISRPGQYPYLPKLTVDQAIASAGGYTYRASKSKVFIRRNGLETEVKLSRSTPVWVLPGDTIRIGERYF